MYTYKVTDDLVVNIYNQNGDLIDYPGPFRTAEEAEEWGSIRVNYLNTYGETNETTNP